VTASFLGRSLSWFPDDPYDLEDHAEGFWIYPAGTRTVTGGVTPDAVGFGASAAGGASGYVYFIYAGTPTPTLLGTIALPGVMTLDTFGSDVDTVLALYDAEGVLLAQNDDAGSPQSMIEIGLVPGRYVAVIGGVGAGFADGFAFTPGSAAGDVRFAVNGSAWGTDRIEAGEFKVYTLGVGTPCNPADFAPPIGVLDLADVTAFATAFVGGDLLVDLDGSGVLDLADVVAFVEAFVDGCP
jgi:hypothetical protein